MAIIRIAAALFDDVTGWLTGALWRLTLLAIFFSPIWVFLI